MMILFIDQGIYKHVIQTKYEFSASLKIVFNPKEKTSNISVSRTTVSIQKI